MAKNNFASFYKFAVYQMRQTDKKVGKLLNKFLGLGICRNCGYEHSSIDGFCEDCQERAFELGLSLIHFSPCEFQIIRKGQYLTRSPHELRKGP